MPTQNSFHSSAHSSARENHEHICRLNHVLQSARSGRKSFFIAESEPRYAPDLLFRVDHIRIEVDLDPVAKTIQAAVTQKLTIVASEISELKFDQIGLRFQEVRLQHKSVRFVAGDDAIRIYPDKPLRAGETTEIEFVYAVTHPRRGMYFTGPDALYPHKPHQTWSQGQDEDNRYWLPLCDYPNQKSTSEVIARVPSRFTAVSNGALLSRKDLGKGVTEFHYSLGVPHVSYLITLVVAELEQWTDKGPGGLPVDYYVAPGRRKDGERAFGNTPQMIEAFARKTGMPYPYEKYAQAAVQDFIFGGMENTSATTQTDLVLHDDRAHLDVSGDPLVSHELAHQWFGDLLTCRDWSHAWLNESFATFMERVWIEESKAATNAAGIDEARYYGFADLMEYLDEDSNAYRRPIVCNSYIEPIDLFDRHLYQKGGLVLNLLRAVLGEEPFWKAIRLYVSRHARGSVETIDLIRAIEDATGRNMRRFFDQWIFGAGHPDFEVSYRWDETRKMIELVVEQKQTGGKPNVTENGVTTALFQVPVLVEWTEAGPGGRESVFQRKIEIGEARERIFLAAGSKPQRFRFDVGGVIPKTLKFPRPKEMLIEQLQKDPDVLGRIEAAQELGRMSELDTIDAVEALGHSLIDDKFWGVRAEVAMVLGKVRTPLAMDKLIHGLKAMRAGKPGYSRQAADQAKTRREIVTALGFFKDARARAVLASAAKSDASSHVEARAITAYARSLAAEISLTGRREEGGALMAIVLDALGRDSHRDVVRAAALRSLAQLPGIDQGEWNEALDLLMTWASAGVKSGRPTVAYDADVRGAAIDALAKIASTARNDELGRILKLFAQIVEEPDFRLRHTLVHALRGTDSPLAISILQRLRAVEIDGRIRRDIFVAIDRMTQEGSVPNAVRLLKESHDKMEEELRRLRAKVEEVEKPGLKTGSGAKAGVKFEKKGKPANTPARAKKRASGERRSRR